MPDDRKKTALLLSLIGLTAIVAYLPALQAGFIWDDDAYIENNVALQTWSGVLRIWSDPTAIPQWYPLVHTSFWIEYRLWGPDPLGYHINNLILHLASCWLLLGVVRRLALPGATLIAGIFALHPVMVESVAWITERKNVLSMVLYLSSLLAYLKYANLASDVSDQERGDKETWFLAFCLFCFALTSKSVTFSLPFTILLITWWKRGRIVTRDVLPLVPFFVAGAGYGILTSYLENVHVGAHGMEWQQSFSEKCLIAGRVPWFYLWKLLWPLELTFIYPRWEIDAGDASQWLFPIATVLAVVGLALLAWKKGLRGPLAALLMFGGTLFPALGFIDVFPFRYSFVADHFQYHASIGIIVFVGAALATWIPPRPGTVIATVIFGLYGARTWVQTEKYESLDVLYNSILADDPESWFAHNNLAAIYITQENWQRGLEFYKKARTLHPALGQKASPEAYAHCMAAKTIADTWSLRPALDALTNQPDTEVIRLRDEVMHRVELSRTHFKKSIQLSPDYPVPYKDLGRLMVSVGFVTVDREPTPEFEEAIDVWSKAIEMTPEDAAVRTMLHELHDEIAKRFERLNPPRTEEAKAHRAAAARVRTSGPRRRR
jgi:tetratricopeptide (TPR) repeat protein